jgi:3-oxoacyl-[acyl-carrier-protein] synthase III
MVVMSSGSTPTHNPHQPLLGKSTGLTALGTYVPTKVLTNRDLESFVDTSDQWIWERTGIRERHISADDEFVSQMAFKAVQNLIDRHGREVLDGVDMVIVATNTPDALFPATAALVQHEFGLKAGGFDLLAACSGWVYALSVAHSLVASGMCQKVLTIGSETLSKMLNWSDRTTCVLFGDGASAGIVEAVPAGYGFQSFVLGADGAGAKHLFCKGTAPRLPDGTSLETGGIAQNGREVYKFATRVMESAALEALAKAGLGIADLDIVVPHQANQRIIDAGRERLGLPESRMVSNIAKYGNTSTASIGLALREAMDDGRISDGQNLLFIAFGGGLLWASCVMRWYAKP